MDELPIPDRIPRPQPVIGIYVLWQGDSCIYVGQSHHVQRRILEHSANGLEFDFYSCIAVEPHEMDAVEAAYTIKLRPSLNLDESGVARSAILRRTAGRLGGRTLKAISSPPGDMKSDKLPSGIVRALPPNVIQERTRHGRTVFYYRSGKGRRLRLPAPGSPGFAKAYEEAVRATATA